MSGTLDDTTLAQQLAARGVRHLRMSHSNNQMQPLDTATLIATLVQHPEPRLREALIPLFILHPEYAPVVPRVVASLEPSAALTLRHMYTAAVYLQRLWHGTLGIYLGVVELLPDYFAQSRFRLPAPDAQFGEAGLRALADHFAQQTGDEWLSAYHSLMNLLLEQLRLEADAREALPVGAT